MGNYVGAAFFVGSFIHAPDVHAELFGSLVDFVTAILMIAWGFYARRCGNRLFPTTRDGASGFSGLWTFLFSPFYFNYKINSIASARQPAA